MANPNQHPSAGLVDATLQNLKNLVDVNTIIGDTIQLPDGTTSIPISKVSFGYGTGGSDIPSKTPGEHFGGGTGGGVTIEPIAFLTIQSGTVKLLQVDQADNTADRIVNLIRLIFDKVSVLCEHAKEKKAAEKAAPKNQDGAGI